MAFIPKSTRQKQEVAYKTLYISKKYEEKINNIFEQADSLSTASEENVEKISNNRPKQVITVEQENINTDENRIDNAQEEQKQETEENSIAKTQNDNFFIRFINKVKSMFKHK